MIICVPPIQCFPVPNPSDPYARNRHETEDPTRCHGRPTTRRSCDTLGGRTGTAQRLPGLSEMMRSNVEQTHTLHVYEGIISS